MDCTLYNEDLKIKARGTQEQMYSMVKHHVPDGMFLLRNFESKEVLVLYRENGTVFPISSLSMLSPDIRLERCAEIGRKTIDDSFGQTKKELLAVWG